MADNTTITPGAGLTVATDDVSSVHYPRVKRSVGADGAATDYLDKASRSDTFNGTGSGTVVDVSAQGFTKFNLQVKATGPVTSWTVKLTGSLDGTNFSPLITHTNVAPGDGLTIGLAANAAPYLYFRAECTALVLDGGTNVVATIVGKP